MFIKGEWEVGFPSAAIPPSFTVPFYYFYCMYGKALLKLITLNNVFRSPPETSIYPSLLGCCLGSPWLSLDNSMDERYFEAQEKLKGILHLFGEQSHQLLHRNAFAQPPNNLDCQDCCTHFFARLWWTVSQTNIFIFTSHLTLLDLQFKSTVKASPICRFAS